MLGLAGIGWSIYSHLSTLQGCLMYRSSTTQGISVKLWVLTGLALVTTPATELITAGLQSHVSSRGSQQHRLATAVLGS